MDGGRDYTRRVFDGPFSELSIYGYCDDLSCNDRNRELEVNGHENAA